MAEAEPPKPSQVPRPSCEEGRENEGPKTGEFSFNGRLWQNFSLKVEKGAHNWYRQHVNSHFFSDEPSISPLGAAVQLLFSPPLIWAFPSSHLGIPFSAFFNCISFVFGQPFVFLFTLLHPIRLSCMLELFGFSKVHFPESTQQGTAAVEARLLILSSPDPCKETFDEKGQKD